MTLDLLLLLFLRLVRNCGYEGEGSKGKEHVWSKALKGLAKSSPVGSYWINHWEKASYCLRSSG